MAQERRPASAQPATQTERTPERTGAGSDVDTSAEEVPAENTVTPSAGPPFDAEADAQARKENEEAAK